MKTRTLFVVALAVALLSAGIAQAQQDAPWLHIRVTEEGEDGAKVSVNLPLSLVQVVADIADKEIQKELAGHGNLDMHMDNHDIEIADIRRAWAELRDAGDADFVEVEEGDEYVKVSRAGDKILINFTEDGDESGRVEVPVAVVNALLSGEGEELNIRAAIDELVATASGEIVFVEDGETTVRVWIE